MSSKDITEAPVGADLERVLQGAIERLNDKLTPQQMEGLAQAFRTVRWEFPDQDMAMHLVVRQESPPSLRYAPSLDSPAQVIITMDSTVLHDAAYGRTSFGTAFITGKLKVKGLNPLKLNRFVPMLKPFLESYREAREATHGAG